MENNRKQLNKFKINLTKSDCHVLNSLMLYDTCKLYIQKSWFNGIIGLWV